MSYYDALISVYDPYQAKRPGFRFNTNEALLCIAINHQFILEPELFGNTIKREKLKIEIQNYILSTDHLPPWGRPILPFITALFDYHDIQPFKDIKMAFLNGYDIDESVWDQEMEGLGRKFNRFTCYDFMRASGLTIETSITPDECSQYDYVLTGNILNDPSRQDIKEIFAACANLAKKDGLVIHGLNYSTAHQQDILSEEFHRICGQFRLDQGPETYIGNQGIIDAMVLWQKEDMLLPKFYLDWLDAPCLA